MSVSRVHESQSLAQLEAYYGAGREAGRLDHGAGLLEFLRTIELIGRYLPPPPLTVADIGGGPGRYALWLADQGYAVEHRDIMDFHVDDLASTASPGIRTAVGDARALDLSDESVDAVLLLGPLYHLRKRADRLTALREARRVVRPGGFVFSAAISRWAPRLDGVLAKRMYFFRELASRYEPGGFFPPTEAGHFTCYAHRPREMSREVKEAGLEEVTLVCVEGLGSYLEDIEARMNDPLDREVVLETARALETVPEVMGLGPHLMSISRRRD